MGSQPALGFDAYGELLSVDAVARQAGARGSEDREVDHGALQSRLGRSDSGERVLRSVTQRIGVDRTDVGPGLRALGLHVRCLRQADRQPLRYGSGWCRSPASTNSNDVHAGARPKTRRGPTGQARRAFRSQAENTSTAGGAV